MVVATSGISLTAQQHQPSNNKEMNWDWENGWGIKCNSVRSVVENIKEKGKENGSVDFPEKKNIKLKNCFTACGKC